MVGGAIGNPELIKAEVSAQRCQALGTAGSEVGIEYREKSSKKGSVKLAVPPRTSPCCFQINSFCECALRCASKRITVSVSCEKLDKKAQAKRIVSRFFIKVQIGLVAAQTD